jgi:hypothetical protein
VANAGDRSSYGIPGHWAPLALRGQPQPEALPYAHLRSQRCRRQVPLLVLSLQAPQGQEDQWRDRQLEPGTLEKAVLHFAPADVLMHDI